MGSNVFQGDDEEADHDKNDSKDSPSGEDFSDKENGPYLRKDWSRAGDGIDEGEIAFPVGLDETDEIDGFKKTRGDNQPPEFRWRLDEEGWKDTEGNEEWEIENRSPEKHPEKEFDGPVSLLGKEIP
jgi:hypothetical protein